MNGCVCCTARLSRYSCFLFIHDLCTLLQVLQANGGEVEATIDAILNIGSVDLVRDQMRH